MLDYIIENNKGLSKCENDNSKYYSNNQCVNNCPKGEKFLDVQEDDKNCLNKCPNNEYKYYSITNDNMFKCLKTCNTYVVSSSANSDNLNLCVEEKCSGIYPYYVIDEIDNNNIKKCYRKCPELYYYKDDIQTDSEDLQCYKNNCPEDYIPYQNSKKCIKEIDCNFIYYKSESQKECVPNCSDNQILHIDNSKYYCLDKCFDFKGYVQNNEKKCSPCTSNEKEIEIKDGENNIIGKKCECLNLFYIEKTRGITKSLKEEENNCINQFYYPYLLYGTKECIDVCNGIISLNGEICYPKKG